MTYLEEELTTIRLCGALRDVPLRELKDPIFLARVNRAAIEREIVRRESIINKEKTK